MSPVHPDEGPLQFVLRRARRARAEALSRARHCRKQDAPGTAGETPRLQRSRQDAGATAWPASRRPAPPLTLPHTLSAVPVMKMNGNGLPAQCISRGGQILRVIPSGAAPQGLCAAACQAGMMTARVPDECFEKVGNGLQPGGRRRGVLRADAQAGGFPFRSIAARARRAARDRELPGQLPVGHGGQYGGGRKTPRQLGEKAQLCPQFAPRLAGSARLRREMGLRRSPAGLPPVSRRCHPARSRRRHRPVAWFRGTHWGMGGGVKMLLNTQ